VFSVAVSRDTPPEAFLSIKVFGSLSTCGKRDAAPVALGKRHPTVLPYPSDSSHFAFLSLRGKSFPSWVLFPLSRSCPVSRSWL
jgi:hypothetical protein